MLQRQTCFRLQQRQEVSDAPVTLQLVAFLLRQFPPVVLVGQFPHLLVLCVREVQTDDRSGHIEFEIALLCLDDFSHDSRVE